MHAGGGSNKSARGRRWEGAPALPAQRPKQMLAAWPVKFASPEASGSWSARLTVCTTVRPILPVAPNTRVAFSRGRGGSAATVSASPASSLEFADTAAATMPTSAASATPPSA